MGDTFIRLSGREVVFSSTGDVDVRKKKTGLGRIFQKITSHIAGDTFRSNITKEVGEKILGRLGQLERPVDISTIARLKGLTTEKAIHAASTDDVFHQVFEKAKVHEYAYMNKERREKDAFLKTLDEPLKKDENGQRDLPALQAALDSLATPQSMNRMKSLYDEMKRLPEGVGKETAKQELATLLAKKTFGTALLTWNKSPHDMWLSKFERSYSNLLPVCLVGGDQDFLFKHILALTSGLDTSNEAYEQMIGAEFKVDLDPITLDKALAGDILKDMRQVLQQVGGDLWRDMHHMSFTLNGERLQKADFYPGRIPEASQDRNRELGLLFRNRMGVSIPDELFLKAGRLIQQGSRMTPCELTGNLFAVGNTQNQTILVNEMSFQEKKDKMASNRNLDAQLAGRNFNFMVSPDKQTVTIDIETPFFVRDAETGLEVKVISKIHAVVCSEEALNTGKKEKVEVSLLVDSMTQGEV